MAAAGLPGTSERPVVACAELALAMLDAVAEAGAPWQIRIGIHRGPVVAGVIGASKYVYDLWGDAVNTASRLETTAAAGSIQVSEAVADMLAPSGAHGRRPGVHPRVARRRRAQGQGLDSHLLVVADGRLIYRDRSAESSASGQDEHHPDRDGYEQEGQREADSKDDLHGSRGEGEKAAAPATAPEPDTGYYVERARRHEGPPRALNADVPRSSKGPLMERKPNGVIGSSPSRSRYVSVTADPMPKPAPTMIETRAAARVVFIA